MQGRLDHKKRTIVDLAVVLYETGEQDKALQLLADNHISDATIARVLTEPDKRRQYVNDLLERTVQNYAK